MKKERKKERLEKRLKNSLKNISYCDLNSIEKFFYNEIEELLENNEIELSQLIGNSVIDIFSISAIDQLIFSISVIDQLIENNGFLIFDYTLKYIDCYGDLPKNVYQILDFALELFISDLGI